MQLFRQSHGRKTQLILATFLVSALWLRGQIWVAGLWHNVGWVWLDRVSNMDSVAAETVADGVRWLQQGVNHFPGDMTMWRALGFAQLARGDEDQARTAWRYVLGMENEFVAWSQEALRQGQIEETAIWLARAQTVAPDSALVWYYWGLFHVGQGDEKAAAAAFQTAYMAKGASELKSSLDLQTGLLLLAGEDAYQTDTVTSLLEAAIEADTFVQPWERVEAHYQLGDAFYRMGCFTEARTQFEYVLNLEPTHYRAKIRLAESVWSASNNWQLAQIFLEEAIALRPENKWAYKVWAAIMVDSGQLDKAKSIYQQVVQLDGADQTAINFLARHEEP